VRHQCALTIPSPVLFVQTQAYASMQGQDPVSAAHVKVFVCHLLDLQQGNNSLYAFYGRAVEKVAIQGVIVSRKQRRDRMTFVVDDGTGCVECIIWSDTFGEHTAPLSEAKVLQQRSIELGALVHVYGKISTWQGNRQITVYHVFPEADTNSEALFIAEVLKLTQDFYSCS
jgi:CST complex subunit STN1